MITEITAALLFAATLTALIPESPVAPGITPYLAASGLALLLWAAILHRSVSKAANEKVVAADKNAADANKRATAAQTQATERIQAAQTQATERIQAAETRTAALIEKIKKENDDAVAEAKRQAAIQIEAADEDATSRVTKAKTEADERIRTVETDADARIEAAATLAARQVQEANTNATLKVQEAERNTLVAIRRGERLAEQLKEDAKKDLLTADATHRNLIRAIESRNMQDRLFVSDLSHDLRNPLQAADLNILHFLRTNRTLPPAVIEKFSTVKELVCNALDLVSTVDAMRRAKGPTWMKIKVAELVAKVVLQNQPQANAKGLTLGVKLKTQEAHINTAPYELLRILDNLVSNAIRYTNEGNVVIFIEKIADQDAFEFSVEDSGAGLTRELIEALEKNRDYEVGNDGDNDGIGGGLSITRRLAQYVEGTLYVQSLGTAGAGSRFSVQIPNQRGDFPPWNPSDIIPSGNAAAKPPFENSTILVVDDELAVLDPLCGLLEVDAGFKVIRAESGRSALEQLELGIPTAIIMDYSLGDMKGTEICERVRARDPKVPIIMYSGHTDYTDACLAAGASHFVLRSGNSYPELLSTLAKLLNVPLQGSSATPNWAHLLASVTHETRSALREFATDALELLRAGQLETLEDRARQQVDSSPNLRPYLSPFLEARGGNENDARIYFEQLLIQSV